MPSASGARHSIDPLLPILSFALIAAALLSMAVGANSIAPSTLLNWLGLPFGDAPQAFERMTLLQLRLPRILLAIAVGAALATAGVAMQGLVRNPLADPGLIGLSSGAALAAALVIVIGTARRLPGLPQNLLLPIAAFLGAAAAAACVLWLARDDGHTRVATLLLAGLAINAIAGAGISLMAYLADDQALRSITFWMFGSLGKAGWQEILIALPLLLLPVALLPRYGRTLNALLLGEPEAGHLGINVESLKRQVMTLVILAVASSVAVAGIIGFIGLIVPHLIRLHTGPDHRRLLPAAALAGALLLLCGDTLSRTILSPAELPIGILTAVIGGPFFLLLLARFRHRPELA